MISDRSNNAAASDLVLIHGWGFNSRIWQDFIPYIEDQWRIKVIDLPGYASSNNTIIEEDKQATSQQMIDAIISDVPDNAIVVGWSLGGLLALKLAAQRNDIKGLILISSSPCFLNKSDWQDGVDPLAFEQLENSLNEDKTKTLREFAGLAAAGDKRAKTVTSKLYEYIDDDAEKPPTLDALLAGLKVLKTEDLRLMLKDKTCPVAIIFGENDVLVKHTTRSAIKIIRPDIQTIEIADAGHAPFLTRPQETAQALTKLIGNFSTCER